MRNLPKRGAMHQPAPDLSTMSGPRVSLRPPRHADCAAVFAYTSDPRASRFLGWAPHTDVEETAAFLKTCELGWLQGKRLRWLIEDETHTVVGMIEAQLSRMLAGIGYVIAPDAWGRGYATEALQTVVDGLFEHTGIPAIWAVCDVENLASARVLDKSGFTRRNALPAYRKCPNIGGRERDFISYVRERD